MTRLADLCGTYRGYRAHIKIGEVADPDCMDANASAMRGYRRSRRVKAGGEVLAKRPDLADLTTPTVRLIAGYLENA